MIGQTAILTAKEKGNDPEEQLSQASTDGKKSTKEVGYKERDKGQQHKVCYQQDDEGKKFSDHRALIYKRLMGCPSRQCFGV